MSLENIQLPSTVLRSLFRRTLIKLKTDEAKDGDVNEKGFSFLGQNNSGIAILVSVNDAVHLSDPDLNFLSGILSACKLNLADVAIINLYNHPNLTKENLDKELKLEKVLLYGISADKIGLPFAIPDFQVQAYDKKKYLLSPSLSDLQQNQELKTRLWKSLQVLFDLKK